MSAIAFERARSYSSWEDVARLEERIATALRRIPLTSTVLLTAPCSAAAGDGIVYALVSGAGVVTISAARAGQLVEVKSRTGGVLTVRDAAGALIDGASTQSVAAYAALLLVWSGQDWGIV